MTLQCALLVTALLASGYACESSSGAAPMAMAGSSMPDMASGTLVSPERQQNPSPATSHPDCSLPWAPGCHAAGPCGSTAVSVSTYAYGAGLIRNDAQPASRNDRPRSVARAPEPPPPRA